MSGKRATRKSQGVTDPDPDPEARRSARATKGQHTKAFDQSPPAKKKGGSKKSKKAEKEEKEEKEEEVEDEEIIRCACGATTQDDDDPDEPWIACEQCGAWQHNVCMGMSIYDDELPKEYFCELCKPEDHKELLTAVAKGEKLWLTRRQKHEEENKKKKTKKGKGKKRESDAKDRSSPAASTTKSKASPAPEVKKEEDAAAKGKRKSRDHSQGPSSKLRKVDNARAVPAPPNYTPPADLAEGIDKLEGSRKSRAEGIRKSLDVALEEAIKTKLFRVSKDTTKKAVTERHAIEIERAVHDSHPNATAAANQIRTLVFNLKKNIELAARVFNRTLTAPALAAMSSDEMQTEELQRKTQQMKELADKQATLITEDAPRVRRTHKGEEVVENDSFTAAEEVPSTIRRQSVRENKETSADSSAHTASDPLRIDTSGKQQSPRQSNFDLEKVFSAVSPGTTQRRPSAPAPAAGPVDDPDVDRMLQDDGAESPPYSPTENLDPDVVWQGHLKMTNLADIGILAKFAGGADLKQVRGIGWDELIPPLVSVAGRIPEDKAVPYLCGLRYNNQVDLVITSLAPASADPNAKSQFMAVINYFQSKQRYGVVGERKLGQVRDTYLIPLPAGHGPLPEILENIDGHQVPLSRPEPLLLMVFVVRDENIPIEPAQPKVQQATPTPSVQATPTPAPDRKPSVPAPTWSPATPQGAFPSNAPPRQPPPVAPPAQGVAQDVNALRQAQIEGEQKARQVLGPLFTSPTVTFLLPHAARMKEGEWNAVKRCIERDPRAREDLPLLSRLLTEEGNNAKQNGTSQPPAPTASPGVVQNTIAAAQATLPSGAPAPAQPKV
ncbi:hypothetical protein BKA67DRAFT_527602 [Truncatella angustata]|uniref:Transcription factor BYE1 n=1 Tax=Truncatella angustata TaxID=152316 RepID=A0A9P8UBM3_9PEZI|nr:uncharacterized protein BKA67DRAFT_527602 [Truncatella angustata]KAH6645110.1 hypothetical protein BKA67DRAFT_527602 [Truncatella angustata]